MPTGKELRRKKKINQLRSVISFLLYGFCIFFYFRQYEELLNTCFDSKNPQTVGLPSVGYCAEQLNLSASYFGELVKKETGQSAQDYILAKVIEMAKGV